MKHARVSAEEMARASYGKLLAWLSSRTRDVEAAEDALADAFRAALETWPKRGVPEKPEAWLLTTARRKLIDQSRRDATRDKAQSDLKIVADEAQEMANRDIQFPDERLKLLFICAHPAIDATIRTPLMLQSVLGMQTDRIASAFVISPTAMSGRLVRAKRKIKISGIPFDPPPPNEMINRLPSVLDAIYAAFGAGWDHLDGPNAITADLTSEAIYLCHLLCALQPLQAEVNGLLSLMLHADARRNARRSIVNGETEFVPLDEQDTDLWDMDQIAKAERILAAAFALNNSGRFQLEAAIQSAHVARRIHGKDTRGDVVLLYESLVRMAPSIGAIVGYAAALGEVGEHDRALKVLDEIPEKAAKTYQPLWAVKAHIFANNNPDEARRCYQRAIGLSSDDATRRYLQSKSAAY